MGKGCYKYWLLSADLSLYFIHTLNIGVLILTIDQCLMLLSFQGVVRPSVGVHMVSIILLPFLSV